MPLPRPFSSEPLRTPGTISFSGVTLRHAGTTNSRRKVSFRKFDTPDGETINVKVETIEQWDKSGKIVRRVQRIKRGTSEDKGQEIPSDRFIAVPDGGDLESTFDTGIAAESELASRQEELAERARQDGNIIKANRQGTLVDPVDFPKDVPFTPPPAQEGRSGRGSSIPLPTQEYQVLTAVKLSTGTLAWQPGWVRAH